MSGPVAILYEDERGGVRDFPLHTVVNTVADLAARSPAKTPHLLRACEKEVPRMPHRVIVAIFDADKLHRLLRRSGDTSRDELLAELRGRCSDPRLRILLLEDNTESLVAAAATCLGREAPERKSKTSRDTLLSAAAWAAQSVRACVRAAVPSFATITDEICVLLPH